MDHCPHCSQTLLFSENPLLHVVRKVSGSHKRYCPDCGRKWYGRSRVYNNGGVFVFVLLGGIVLMFGFFQFAGSIQLSSGKMRETINDKIMNQAIKTMSESPAAQAELKKYGINSPAQAVAKIKKLKSNPAAMAKLKAMGVNPESLMGRVSGAQTGSVANMRDMAANSGYSKEMVDKAVKYMERNQ